MLVIFCCFVVAAATVGLENVDSFKSGVRAAPPPWLYTHKCTGMAINDSINAMHPHFLVQ